MPERANRRANRASTRRSVQDTSTRTRATSRTRTQQPQAANEDEAWDEVMDMKSGGGGDDGSFNKLNTNFWLKNGEEIDVVILDENPTVFWGHVIKCKTDAGRTFYRTEQCQKSEQDFCEMCDMTDNKAVSKAKRIIAFRILDSRGSWDKDLNDGDDGS